MRSSDEDVVVDWLGEIWWRLGDQRMKKFKFCDCDTTFGLGAEITYLLPSLVELDYWFG